MKGTESDQLANLKHKKTRGITSECQTRSPNASTGVWELGLPIKWKERTLTSMFNQQNKNLHISLTRSKCQTTAGRKLIMLTENICQNCSNASSH
jgi:hypothetical protein